MKTIDAKTTIKLQNVLYATDFSQASEAAFPFAAEIARRYGSTIFGVHVRAPEMQPTAAPETLLEWPEIEKAWEEQGKREAQQLDQKLQGFNHKVFVVEGKGKTWPVLSKIVKENNIDLIVLGTRGRHGLGKAMLGSQAEEILRQAPCPVVTVGPKAGKPNPVFEVNRILYATDFSEGSLAAAPYAISLAQENEAALDLLHVIDKEQVGDLVGPNELAKSLTHRLEQLVPAEVDLWCQPNYFVDQGEAADCILRMAEMRRADLIVLGVKHAERHLTAVTHFPWTTAHKVVSLATCPVLTVRG